MSSVDLGERELFQRLKEVKEMLGGKQKAYSIEPKTRMFIDEILKVVSQKVNSQLSEGQKLFVDMEVEMRLFNEIIRPDYQLMLQSAQSQDVPLFVIEVKRTDNKTNLKDHFDQHFKQLRHICL